ncbi:MAG: formyltransferase family protein [Bdellovibrionota bacterium]
MRALNKKSLKILLFGNPWGVPISVRHIDASQICGIVGAEIRPEEHEGLENIANSLSVPVLIQPRSKSIEIRGFIDQVKHLEPNLILVNGYSMLIPVSVFELPKLGTFNIHGALLPRHRGPNPIQWALIGDDRYTGVTIHQMTSKIDDGDIVGQKRFRIQFTDTWQDILSKMEEATHEVLAEVLPHLIDNRALSVKQNDFESTRNRRREIEDGRFDWCQPTIAIYNLIRALVEPLPGAFSLESGKKTKFNGFVPFFEVLALKAQRDSEVLRSKQLTFEVSKENESPYALIFQVTKESPKTELGKLKLIWDDNRLVKYAWTGAKEVNQDIEHFLRRFVSYELGGSLHL